MYIYICIYIYIYTLIFISLLSGIWGIRSTPSLPLLPGPFWPGVVALDRALSMG